MKSVKIKVPAKVNLTLEITGKDGNYHTLKSLVTSVSLFDEGVFIRRNDGKLNLNFTGFDVGVDCNKSNAYKAGVRFIEKYAVGGADVTVNRKIPAGGGLGGSSADTACMLKGLKALYGVKEDVSNLALEFGSDTLYMLNGGYALMEGRGEKITPLDISAELFFILVTGDKGVNSGDCYNKYDEICTRTTFWTDGAIRFIKNGDISGFVKTLKNDLYPASVVLNPEIKENIEKLKPFGAACMTGSGSTVFAVYKSRKQRDTAYKKLLPIFGDKIIKAKTVR